MGVVINFAHPFLHAEIRLCIGHGYEADGKCTTADLDFKVIFFRKCINQVPELQHIVVM